MWSARTAHRRKQQFNKNSYVFDNTFQCRATREINSSIAQLSHINCFNLIIRFFYSAEDENEMMEEIHHDIETISLHEVKYKISILTF